MVCMRRTVLVQRRCPMLWNTDGHLGAVQDPPQISCCLCGDKGHTGLLDDCGHFLPDHLVAERKTQEARTRISGAAAARAYDAQGGRYGGDRGGGQGWRQGPRSRQRVAA